MIITFQGFPDGRTGSLAGAADSEQAQERALSGTAAVQLEGYMHWNGHHGDSEGARRRSHEPIAVRPGR